MGNYRVAVGLLRGQ